jgi:Transglutaminase-like superfamily
MVMTVPWLHRPFSVAERLTLAVEILVVYVKARWWMRREGVETAVARLRAGGPAPGGPDDSLVSYTAVARLGGVVLRTLAPLPADTRCLARSLVLTGLLARRGLRSTLVIGVSPGPEFKAHAWVEHWERPALPAGDGEYERLLEL